MGLFSGSASLVPKPHTLNSLAQKMADNEILSLFAGFHYCQDTWPPFSIRGEKKLAHDDLIDQDSKWKLIQCSFALLFVLTMLLEWEWGPRRLIDSSQSQSFPVMEKKHFCAMCEKILKGCINTIWATRLPNMIHRRPISTAFQNTFNSCVSLVFWIWMCSVFSGPKLECFFNFLILVVVFAGNLNITSLLF